jgi:hypothetical protein
VLATHHRLVGTPMLEPDTVTLTCAWTEAHRDFHPVLGEACGSAWLLRFRDVLSDQAERYRRLSVRKDPAATSRLSTAASRRPFLARTPEQALEMPMSRAASGAHTSNEASRRRRVGGGRHRADGSVAHLLAWDWSGLGATDRPGPAWSSILATARFIYSDGSKCRKCPCYSANE